MYFFFIAPEATAYELKKTHVIKGAWRLPEITARGAGAGGRGRTAGAGANPQELGCL
jgi:hypothetical protein